MNLNINGPFDQNIPKDPLAKTEPKTTQAFPKPSQTETASLPLLTRKFVDLTQNSPSDTLQNLDLDNSKVYRSDKQNVEKIETALLKKPKGYAVYVKLEDIGKARIYINKGGRISYYTVEKKSGEYFISGRKINNQATCSSKTYTEEEFHHLPQAIFEMNKDREDISSLPDLQTIHSLVAKVNSIALEFLQPIALALESKLPKIKKEGIKAFTDYGFPLTGEAISSKAKGILGEQAYSKLIKGCSKESGITTAREAFFDFILNLEKDKTKEKTITKGPLSLDDFGKEGLKLLKAAQKEEKKDPYFRAAAFLAAYKEEKRTPPKESKIILVTGVSGAGKSTTVEEIKNNKDLIPEDGEGDVSQFIEIDASHERALSRVTKIALDYADRLGFSGVNEIHKGSKVKGFIEKAAKELMKTKTICMVVPMTFARQGVINLFSTTLMKVSPLSKYLNFAKENKAGIVYVEIQGLEKNLHRASTKVLGDQRAWTSEDKAVTGDYDLMRGGRKESKDYEAENYVFGKKGSRAGGEWIQKLKQTNPNIKYQLYKSDLVATYIEDGEFRARVDSKDVQLSDVVLSERNMMIWRLLKEQLGNEKLKDEEIFGCLAPIQVLNLRQKIENELKSCVNKNDLKEFASCCYKYGINKNHIKQSSDFSEKIQRSPAEIYFSTGDPIKTVKSWGELPSFIEKLKLMPQGFSVRLQGKLGTKVIDRLYIRGQSDETPFFYDIQKSHIQESHIQESEGLFSLIDTNPFATTKSYSKEQLTLLPQWISNHYNISKTTLPTKEQIERALSIEQGRGLSEISESRLSEIFDKHINNVLQELTKTEKEYKENLEAFSLLCSEVLKIKQEDDPDRQIVEAMQKKSKEAIKLSEEIQKGFTPKNEESFGAYACRLFKGLVPKITEQQGLFIDVKGIQESNKEASKIFTSFIMDPENLKNLNKETKWQSIASGGMIYMVQRLLKYPLLLREVINPIKGDKIPDPLKDRLRKELEILKNKEILTPAENLRIIEISQDLKNLEGKLVSASKPLDEQREGVLKELYRLETTLNETAKAINTNTSTI